MGIIFAVPKIEMKVLLERTRFGSVQFSLLPFNISITYTKLYFPANNIIYEL